MSNRGVSRVQHYVNGAPQRSGNAMGNRTSRKQDDPLLDIIILIGTFADPRACTAYEFRARPTRCWDTCGIILRF